MNSPQKKLNKFSLKDLLNAINEIKEICYNTNELGSNFTDKEAMDCDEALTDIFQICEKFPKHY